MALDLYAGIPVSDYPSALAWYERLLGSPPTFEVSATEAVWEFAEHRSVFVGQRVDDAGHAMHTIFVDDLDALVEQIGKRGLEPAKRETYSNGVRKVSYRDPDGNEIDLAVRRSQAEPAPGRGSPCPVLPHGSDVPGDHEPPQPERSSHMHATSESATRTVLFARLAVVAAVAYQLLLIALILVRPEIDPARKPISEYAIGRLGWLATWFPNFSRCLCLPRGRSPPHVAGQTRPDRDGRAVVLRGRHRSGRPLRGGPGDHANE